MSHSQPKNIAKKRTHYRLWMTELGHGDNAVEGLLITDNSPLPIPVAWIDGRSLVARKAAERIVMGEPIEEWASRDLRGGKISAAAQAIDGNLLFPTGAFENYKCDPDFAAARYTVKNSASGAVQFSVLNFAALREMLMGMPCILRGPELEAAIESEEMYEERTVGRRELREKDVLIMLHRLISHPDARRLMRPPMTVEGK